MNQSSASPTRLTILTLAGTVYVVMSPTAVAQPDAHLSSLTSIQNWTIGNPVDGKHAYSIGRRTCNIGDEPLDWIQGPNPTHPVTAPNLYRLQDGRFEQIGRGWVMHHLCALQQGGCGTCQPVGNCCCAGLGPNCSTSNAVDTTGLFGIIGPRSEINVHPGTNQGVHSSPEGPTALRGRVIVEESDVDVGPSSNAMFFAEVQIVTADDAQAADMSLDNDNASYRQALVNQNTFFMGITGDTIRGQAAIHAWPENDPSVTLENIDIPNEGRLILAYKASPNDDGTWHYEYALHNLTSDRAVGLFSIPIPPDVTLTNIGFHDIDAHSGEIHAIEDWPADRNDNTLTWATEPFENDPLANALRWGTLYNFRFDADTPPQPATLNIGLFKPGTPDAVSAIVAAPLPACPAPALANAFQHTAFGDHAFDGYIDPRAESTDGQSLDVGLDAITLVFNTPLENPDGSTLSASAFTLTDSSASAPTITRISTEDNRVVTIRLNETLTVAEWTTVTLNAQTQCDQSPLSGFSIDIGFLPGDVDQNGAVTPVDLFIFRQYLNELSTPPMGVVADYLDTDRNSEVTPIDLFAYRQLINGIKPATRTWAGQQLPPKP